MQGRSYHWCSRSPSWRVVRPNLPNHRIRKRHREEWKGRASLTATSRCGRSPPQRSKSPRRWSSPARRPSPDRRGAPGSRRSRLQLPRRSRLRRLLRPIKRRCRFRPWPSPRFSPSRSRGKRRPSRGRGASWRPERRLPSSPRRLVGPPSRRNPRGLRLRQGGASSSEAEAEATGAGLAAGCAELASLAEFRSVFGTAL